METNVLFIIKMIIIGLVQGFTEPIPVSSSGHVMIVSELLDLGEQGFTFAILTNTASLFAILFVYRKDIARLTVNSLSYIRTRDVEKRVDFFFVVYLIIATIPAGVLGVLLSDYIAETVSVFLVGIALLVTGVAIWLVRHMDGVKDESSIKVGDAVFVGLGQALALMPGISRSGATIISSIATGMNRETALRFSFMLYIPVSLGGLVLGVSDFLDEADKGALFVPYSAAFIATLVMTYVALKWFIDVMKRGKLIYFAYYCFIVGSLLIIFY